VTWSGAKRVVWAGLALTVVAGLTASACLSAEERAGWSQVDQQPRLEVPGGLDVVAPVEDVAEDTGSSPPDAVEPDGSTGKPGGSPCESHGECLVGWCLMTREGPRCPGTCVTQACAAGQECVEVASASGLVTRLCVDPLATLCQPCADHADCEVVPTEGQAGPRCLSYPGEGRFCGLPCDAGRPCPAGYTCWADGQCRSDAGACECTPWSVEVRAATACRVTNAAGSCEGLRVCEEGGLTDCDAATPAPEVCNGRDDDCNGLVDDGATIRAECGAYVCAGVLGCLGACATDADCASGWVCDRGEGLDDVAGECVRTGLDGSACDDDGDCHSGYCAGGFCCAGPEGLCCAVHADCAALDQEATCSSAGAAGCAGSQVVGRCEAFTCQPATVAAPHGCEGAPCAGGACAPAGFIPPGHCDASGGCAPLGAIVPCDDGDPCTLDGCSPTEGCLASPRTGVTSAACYTFDPSTRGLGVCEDGVLVCEGGEAVACQGQVGPGAELCNGLDDDCNGLTDDGVGPQCWPYACKGVEGCATSCQGAADCAPGAFCDGAGACQPSGATGTSCVEDAHCASGRCRNGICCQAGTCCGEDAHCAAFDSVHCGQAGPGGCSGTRTAGLCDAATHQCVGATTLDPGGCEGVICDAASCEGLSLRPASVCDPAGACVAVEGLVDCAPHRCEQAACTASCESTADCAPGVTCSAQGECEGSVPDGGPCTNDGQCANGRCEAGYCCVDGHCCGDDGDCAVFDEAPVCEQPGACAGSQVVGRCGADAACTTVSIASPGACAGRLCGDVECVNLVGTALIREGVVREQCSPSGQCEEVLTDCRDLGFGGRCTDLSAGYLWCNECSPNRTTCVVFTDPCFCE